MVQHYYQVNNTLVLAERGGFLIQIEREERVPCMKRKSRHLAVSWRRHQDRPGTPCLFGRRKGHSGGVTFPIPCWRQCFSFFGSGRERRKEDHAKRTLASATAA
jgi:hypothetical protein